MKNLFLLVLFMSGLLVNTSSAIDVSITSATFKGKTNNYIELYFYIVGNTVHYKTIDNQPQASVETLILFKQNNEIVKYDKYILNSPKAVLDSSFNAPNFTDLKRYALENGTYQVEIAMKDLHHPENVKNYEATITMGYSDEKVLLSDIQPVKAFRKAEESESNIYIKNGYYFESQPFGFYPRIQDRLFFYAEVYNTKAVLNDDYFVRYYIQPDKADAKPVQMSYKRLKAEDINILVLQLDISKLPSGNYNLVLEARNRNNELLFEKSSYFQRSNPYVDLSVETYADNEVDNTFVDELEEKQLNYCLRAVTPIAGIHETDMLNSITKSDNIDMQRQFLFTFWASRNPNDTKGEFMRYMEQANAVDKKFGSTLGYGFEMDRGYIYLKYGQPNDVITETSDPSAPPYEVWEYYELRGQQNVKFVFYNPSLVVNDFTLLHSNLRGEVNNPQWKRILYKNARQGGNFIDGTGVENQFGRNIDRIFDN